MSDSPSKFVTISAEGLALVQRMGDTAGATAVMAKALDYENQLTVGYIAQHKLSQRGSMTLGVVTNRLRSSIRATKTIPGTGATGLVLLSSIGSNAKYAGPHEFGWEGDVQVKEHTRKVNRLRMIGDGKIISKTLAARLGFLTKTGKPRSFVKTDTSEQKVKAHTRHVKIKARHYVSSSIDARLPMYSAALSGALVKHIGGGK